MKWEGGREGEGERGGGGEGEGDGEMKPACTSFLLFASFSCSLLYPRVLLPHSRCSGPESRPTIPFLSPVLCPRAKLLFLKKVREQLAACRLLCVYKRTNCLVIRCFCKWRPELDIILVFM